MMQPQINLLEKLNAFLANIENLKQLANVAEQKEQALMSYYHAEAAHA